MDNEKARELLYDFQEAAVRSLRAATWAEAFLLEGGEPTWDAVKGVSDAADELQVLAGKVAKLRDTYQQIAPF